MGREFELKYRADQETLTALRERYGPFEEIQMQTTYFDTFDGKLLSRHWTLRQRMENGTSVCTLKIPLPDGSRGEWETVSQGLMTGIPALCRQGAPMELMALTVGGLVPTCGARFTRLAKTIPLENGRVELALDQGVLTGSGREQPLWEVEVELKDGCDEAAIAFAAALAREFSLEPEPQSKYRRALLLAHQ
ncbi:MAG: CYTH domain-containing protein [Firmicutes bacterium]|nr:CYTH domain-containing protein [Bacillota bacterium]